MPDLFDTWKRASFGGIEFPFTDLDIAGSLRKHTHEYLKRPGGEVEALGRRCYVFSFKCRFVDVFEAYADLYPSRLSALISLCESERTYELWIPPMERSFQAKATEWRRSITAMLRNGEDVSFTFEEDSTEQYTTLNLIGTRASAFPQLATELAVEIRALEDPSLLDAFNALLEAIDAFLTVVSLVQAEIDYQTARVDGVIRRCQALANLPAMQRAPAAPALLILINVWALAAQTRAEVLSASRPILLYRVERDVMSVIDVSVDIYGTPAKSGELLRFNDLDNAMRITRGTYLRYLPTA
jgi:hypothetical protein